MAETEEVSVNEFGVDVAVRTIRGRSCPVCAGKIIPSNRAVYQSAGDPSEVFALWECERCGHSEWFAKPVEAKKVHGGAPKALPGGPKTGVASGTTAPAVSATKAAQTKDAATRGAAQRAMPPDVRKMLEVMNRSETKAGE